MIIFKQCASQTKHIYRRISCFWIAHFLTLGWMLSESFVQVCRVLILGKSPFCWILYTIILKKMIYKTQIDFGMN